MSKDSSHSRKVLHSVANDITILSTYLERLQLKLNKSDAEKFKEELGLLKDSETRIDHLIESIKEIQNYFRSLDTK